MQLKSISELLALDLGPESYLDLHLNDQKYTIFAFFFSPFVRLNWLVEEIEN
jgi:hypothetical protein